MGATELEHNVDGVTAFRLELKSGTDFWPPVAHLEVEGPMSALTDVELRAIGEWFIRAGETLATMGKAEARP